MSSSSYHSTYVHAGVVDADEQSDEDKYAEYTDDDYTDVSDDDDEDDDEDGSGTDDDADAYDKNDGHSIDGSFFDNLSDENDAAANSKAHHMNQHDDKPTSAYSNPLDIDKYNKFSAWKWSSFAYRRYLLYLFLNVFLIFVWVDIAGKAGQGMRGKEFLQNIAFDAGNPLVGLTDYTSIRKGWAGLQNEKGLRQAIYPMPSFQVILYGSIAVMSSHVVAFFATLQRNRNHLNKTYGLMHLLISLGVAYLCVGGMFYTYECTGQIERYLVSIIYFVVMNSVHYMGCHQYVVQIVGAIHCVYRIIDFNAGGSYIFGTITYVAPSEFVVYLLMMNADFELYKRYAAKGFSRPPNWALPHVLTVALENIRDHVDVVISTWQPNLRNVFRGGGDDFAADVPDVESKGNFITRNSYTVTSKRLGVTKVLNPIEYQIYLADGDIPEAFNVTTSNPQNINKYDFYESMNVKNINWYRVLASANDFYHVSKSLLLGADISHDEDQQLNQIYTNGSLPRIDDSDIDYDESMSSEDSDSFQEDYSCQSSSKLDNSLVPQQNIFCLEHLIFDTFSMLECLHSTPLGIYMLNTLNSQSMNRLDLSGITDLVVIKEDIQFFRMLLHILIGQGFRSRGERVIYSVYFGQDQQAYLRNPSLKNKNYQLYFQETTPAKITDSIGETIYFYLGIEDTQILSYVYIFFALCVEFYRAFSSWISTRFPFVDSSSDKSFLSILQKNLVIDESHIDSQSVISSLAKQVTAKTNSKHFIEFYEPSHPLVGLVTKKKSLSVPAELVDFVRQSVAIKYENIKLNETSDRVNSHDETKSPPNPLERNLSSSDGSNSVHDFHLHSKSNSFYVTKTIESNKNGVVLATKDICSENFPSNVQHWIPLADSVPQVSESTNFHTYIWIKEDLDDSLHSKSWYSKKEEDLGIPSRMQSFFGQVGVPIKEGSISEILSLFCSKVVTTDIIENISYAESQISDDDVWSTSVTTSHIKYIYDRRSVKVTTFLVPDWTGYNCDTERRTFALRNLFRKLGVLPSQIIVYSDKASMTPAKIYESTSARSTNDYLSNDSIADPSIVVDEESAGIEVGWVLYKDDSDVAIFDNIVNRALHNVGSRRSMESKEKSTGEARDETSSKHHEGDNFFYFTPNEKNSNLLNDSQLLNSLPSSVAGKQYGKKISKPFGKNVFKDNQPAAKGSAFGGREKIIVTN